MSPFVALFDGKCVKLILLTFLLVLLLAGCTGSGQQTITPTPNDGLVQEQEAIEIAIENCDIGRLSAVRAPKEVQAELTTIGDAAKSLTQSTTYDQPAELAVWLVIMEGKWALTSGPPPEQDTTPSAQQIFNQCTVILEAQTGRLITIQAK